MGPAVPQVSKDPEMADVKLIDDWQGGEENALGEDQPPGKHENIMSRAAARTVQTNVASDAAQIVFEIARTHLVRKDQLTSLLPHVIGKNVDMTKVDKALRTLFYVVGNGESAKLSHLKDCFKLTNVDAVKRVVLSRHSEAQHIGKLADLLGMQLPDGEMATFVSIFNQGRVSIGQIRALSHNKADPNSLETVDAIFTLLGDGNHLEINDLRKAAEDTDWWAANGVKLVAKAKRLGGFPGHALEEMSDEEPEAKLRKLLHSFMLSASRAASSKVNQLAEHIVEVVKEDVLPHLLAPLLLWLAKQKANGQVDEFGRAFSELVISPNLLAKVAVDGLKIPSHLSKMVDKFGTISDLHSSMQTETNAFVSAWRTLHKNRGKAFPDGANAVPPVSLRVWHPSHQACR